MVMNSSPLPVPIKGLSMSMVTKLREYGGGNRHSHLSRLFVRQFRVDNKHLATGL